MEKAGAGAEKAGEFYGQVAADHVMNDYVDQTNKRLYGDPNKQVAGPDGAMVQDTGFFGLKGAAMLAARPQLAKDMDEDLKAARSQLTSAESQFQFDTFSRRFRQIKDSEVGSRAEQANTEWMVNTNKDTINQTVQEITRDADNDNAFDGYRENLRHAFVKQAQAQGLTDDASTQSAISNADAIAWKTRIETIGVKDPSRAHQMADDNKAELGKFYPEVSDSLRTRAAEAKGLGYVEAHGAGQLPTPPLPAEAKPVPVSAAVPGAPSAAPGAPPPLAQPAAKPGMAYDPRAQLSSNVANIIAGPESHGSYTIRNSHFDTNWDTQASGRYQFLGSTWRSLAAGDPEAAIYRTAAQAPPEVQDRMAQKLVALNAAAFRRGGVAVNDLSMYAAWAIGTGEATPLLQADPNAPVNRIPGIRTISLRANPGYFMNPDGSFKTVGQALDSMARALQGVRAPAAAYAGGTPDVAGRPGYAAPVGPGVAMPLPQVAAPGSEPGELPAPGVIEAMGALPPAAAPPDVKSQVFDAIERDATMTPEEKQVAMRAAAQRIAQNEIADGQNERIRKETNDKAASDYVTEIMTGAATPALIAQIAADPRLTSAETKENLYAFATNKGGLEDIAQYGSGYTAAYKAIFAEPGDPTRINSADQILKRGMPGGDLTGRGVQRLMEIYRDSRKNPDQESINRAKLSMITYARDKLTFDESLAIPGVPQSMMKDPKGKAIFDGAFVPKFESAYAQWLKDGKDPYEFLRQDNIDKMIAPLRKPNQMAMDRIAASGEAVNQVPGAAAAEPIPPAPKNVDPQVWGQVLSRGRPSMANGQLWPVQGWAQAVQFLVENPTAENRAAFNEYFPRAPLAADIVAALRQAPEGSPAAPGVLAPAGTIAPPPLAQPAGWTPQGPTTYQSPEFAAPRAAAPSEPLIEIGKFNPMAAFNPELGRDIDAYLRWALSHNPKVTGEELRQKLNEQMRTRPEEQR